MANTFKFGNGNWAVKDGSALAYNDENNNFKPLPFDFTRASSATRVNKQGLIETVPSGKPRIDFLNNTDGHLLLEPLRRNFLTYSEDFSNWTLNGDSISETSSTAFGKPIWTLTESSSTYLGIFRSATGVTIGTVTASALVKANTANTITLRYGSPTNKNVTFNLSNGTITFESSGASGTITSYGDRWYLCTNTVTITSSTQSFAVYTNSGSVDVIHAQLEAGSYATSYIPTEGSSVTRVAEYANDAGNSQVFNNDTGVWFIDLERIGLESGRAMMLANASGSEQIRIHFDTTAQIRSRDAKASFATIGGNISMAVGTRKKVALKIDGTTLKVFADGSQIGSNYTRPTAFDIHSMYAAEDAFKLFDARFYNTALTDTELQNLTS